MVDYSYSKDNAQNIMNLQPSNPLESVTTKVAIFRESKKQFKKDQLKCQQQAR